MPVQKRNAKNKDKKEKVSVKSETKIKIDKKKLEIKAEENDCSEEEPVKRRKRGRPSSLDNKGSSLKKGIKKSLIVKKTTPEVIVEKRGRGRPRKVVESVNTEKTPVKHLKTKVKNLKENSTSEGIKATKNTSPSKTKSPTKESEIDENITSTTERLKDSDVEDETVSSSCQDLVRSVKVQTKPISKKPPKSYISKVCFVN